MNALPADLVFTGGPVLTMNASRTVTYGAAVRNGRVIALGQADAEQKIGPATRVVDLRDKLLLPAFQDAHVHPVTAGLRLQSLDLSAISDATAYGPAIAEHVRANPDRRDWVVGSGWQTVAFRTPPTRHMLDEIVADRPVFLVNVDAHSAWVNSRALHLAGITADTPEPSGGRIERDASGGPTGLLHDGAMALVARLLPAETAEDRLRALLTAQAHLHSVGVTAWQDALIGTANGMQDSSDAYAAAISDGSLKSKVVGALWWDRDRGLEQIPELKEKRKDLAAAGFRASSVKMMLDGVPESRTAAMLHPYCGCADGHAGEMFIDPRTVVQAAIELDRSDFDLHFHALGDASVRLGLDAVQAARTANGWKESRHQIAHVYQVDDEDVRRFARLGVTANLQMAWAVGGVFVDDFLEPVLGRERAGRQHPFAQLRDACANIAAGSDWPVSSPNPMEAIHVAVNRTPPGGGVPPLLIEQRLDVLAAIAAYTTGSAYVNRFEQSGTIALGAVADLVVLDQNPLLVESSDLGGIRPTMTIGEGDVLYEDCG